MANSPKGVHVRTVTIPPDFEDKLDQLKQKHNCRTDAQLIRLALGHLEQEGSSAFHGGFATEDSDNNAD